jgi:MazG family protein
MQPAPAESLAPLERLRAIVAALRAPGGCPWDREQTHASLRAGLLEEACEVVAAIDAGDDANLREELGDLLLHVVFHSDIARTEARWDLDAVARELCEKLIRRHPHVFGGEQCTDSGEVLRQWDAIKRAEKGTAPDSVLDGIPATFSALMRAEKLQKKAAKVGFDWPDAAPVFAKVREELAEVADAPPEKREEEIGDLLFAVVNLARKLGLEAETALGLATRKFEARFRAVEQLARARGIVMERTSLSELDALWAEVKARP